MDPMWTAVLASTVVAATVTGLFNLLLQRKEAAHAHRLAATQAALAKQLEAHKADWEARLETQRAELEGKVDADRAELQRQTAQLALVLPQQEKLRNHLAETRTLLHRVQVSFDRLSRLAPTLCEDEILIETTNTLDIYASYVQHLSTGEFASYPDDLKRAIAALQTLLSRIFLDLQVAKDKRETFEFKALMTGHMARLLKLKEAVTAEADSLIRVPLRIVA